MHTVNWGLLGWMQGDKRQLVTGTEYGTGRANAIAYESGGEVTFTIVGDSKMSAKPSEKRVAPRDRTSKMKM